MRAFCLRFVHAVVSSFKRVQNRTQLAIASSVRRSVELTYAYHGGVCRRIKQQLKINDQLFNQQEWQKSITRKREQYRGWSYFESSLPGREKSSLPRGRVRNDDFSRVGSIKHLWVRGQKASYLSAASARKTFGARLFGCPVRECFAGAAARECRPRTARCEAAQWACDTAAALMWCSLVCCPPARSPNDAKIVLLSRCGARSAHLATSKASAGCSPVE